MITSPEIWSVARQGEEVRAVRNRKDYKDFVQSCFHDFDWAFDIDDELKHVVPNYLTNTQAYFGMLGMVVVHASQYAFPLIEGIARRHKGHNWKQPFLDPYHSAALLSYLGGITIQVLDSKREIAERIAKGGQVDANSIWGVVYPVYKGKAELPQTEEDKREYEKKAIWRMRPRRDPNPICLPDEAANRQLADLKFTGDRAETMTNDEFLSEFYPNASIVFAHYFDPEVVFKRER